MKSLVLPEHVRQKIDKRVDRLLRDLGLPEPPLKLEDVRDWMKLDIGFFRAEEPGLLDRAIHKMRVGTIQAFRRPTLVLEAIKKFNLRALCAPDLKRIRIDESVPSPKHRWLTAHEIIHMLLVWHHALLLGDNDITPTAACRAKIEAEANYGAGQLLFLRDRFYEEASSSALNLATIVGYKKTYGNSHTSTLWRAVELLGRERPLLGVITAHPHMTRRPADFDESQPCKYFVQSEAFARQFSNISEQEVFRHLSTYCGAQRGGPLGEAEIVLSDVNAEEHVFTFETFFNSHEALTLAIYDRKKATTITVAAA